MALIWVDGFPQQLGENIPAGLKCFCGEPATTIFYGASKLPVCYLCRDCVSQWEEIQAHE